MQILEAAITVDELRKIAEATFGDIVKAVVDTDRQLIALDAELHSDLEAMLLGNGSEQNSLWGINLYPDLTDEDFIEFDSLINIRPSQGNKTRSVDSKDIQKKIRTIVNRWIRH